MTYRRSLLCGGLQLRLPLLSLIPAALQLFLQGQYGGVHPLPLLFYLVLGLKHGHTHKKKKIALRVMGASVELRVQTLKSITLSFSLASFSSKCSVQGNRKTEIFPLTPSSACLQPLKKKKKYFCYIRNNTRKYQTR